MIDLKGKVAVVFGLANKRSIAYSVAQKLAEAGATLVLSYQMERLKSEADELLKDLGRTGEGRAFQCDVSRDEEIDALFSQIAAAFPKIDILIHSVAFAPADAIKNDFLLTAREDFRCAPDDRWRSHADADLLRRGEGLPQLQRDGRGQGCAGSDGALPCGFAGDEEHSRQRRLGRPDQDPGGAWHRRLQPDPE